MQIVITPSKQLQHPSDIKTDIFTNQYERSPLRRVQSVQYSVSDNQNENDLSQSRHYGQYPMSLTQKQITSHDIILQITQQHNNKTVKHVINKIQPNTQLYAKPIKENKKQNSDQVLTSHCSKKIHEIYEKISNNKSMDERMVELAEKNIEKARILQKKSRPRSSSLQPNLNKKVSVSGLVSYNFNSVSARKSLSFNPKGSQADFLKQKINEVNRRNSCSITRRNAIIARKPGKSSLKKQALAKTGTSDFTMPTKKFLSSLLKLAESEEQIYGQKMCKLDAIKDYMESQRTNYEDARFIVNQIAASQPQKPKIKKQIEKFIIDEEKQIRLRRVIHQKKRVMLKHLYFADS